MIRLISVQLTTRCDLACSHCMVGRNGTDLPVERFRDVVRLAGAAGCGCLSLTGGEPSLHTEIGEILEILRNASLRFLLISNGWSFRSFLPSLRRASDSLVRCDFSLDGATAEVHDRIRETGSFDRVLDAVECCKAEGIAYGLRSALHRGNLRDIDAIARLAESIGASQVAFLPPLPTRRMVAGDLYPSPVEQMRMYTELERVRRSAAVAVVPSVGFFSWNVLRPCPTLNGTDLFVNAAGQLGFCCTLSGAAGEGDGADILGVVQEFREAEAARIAGAAVDRFRTDKRVRFERGDRGPLDFFPCWYCLKHFRKVEWLGELAGNAWASDLAEA